METPLPAPRHCGMTELSPVFIGRETEIRWFLEEFEQNPRRMSVRLITGSSGLGKTALLQEAARQIKMAHPEALVLSGNCEERERGIYKAFDSILEMLGRWLADLSREERLQLVPRHAFALSQVFPQLAMLSELEAETGVRMLALPEPGEIRQMAFMALRELLGRISDRRPVALLIDDIQWADEDSLRLLDALTQPTVAPAMLLGLCLRTHVSGGLAAQMLARLEKMLPAMQMLRLRPLSMEASLALIRSLLQANPEFREVDPQVASRIAREAGGQPLFIYELLYHMRIVGDSPKAVLKLEDVLWSRISVLDEDFISLLELVCVSFGPLRMDQAAHVLGRTWGEVFRIAARLRLLHLVRISGPLPEDEIEPYHDRVRDTVMEHMDANRATRWHERIVQELQTRPDVAPERMASHLVCLERTRDAASFLAAAAQDAAKQLAFDRAAGLWLQAIQLRFPPEDSLSPEDVEELRAWMEECARALWGAGRGRESAQLLLRVAEGMPDGGLELRRQAAERLMVSGYLDEGIEVSRGIAETLGVHLPRSSTKAALSLLWSRFRVRLRGLDFVRRDSRDLSPQRLLHADILASLARGLALTNHILGSDCSARYLLVALDLGEPRRVMEALTMEANFAASVSVKSPHVQRILDVVETQRKLCRDFDADLYVHAAHGYVGYMNGEWKKARENARAAFNLWSAKPGTFWERTLMRLQMCWSTFYLGEMAELAREVPSVAREAENRGDLFTLASMVSGLNNTVFLETESPENAQKRVEEVMARWSHGGYHMQHYFALLARVQAALFAIRPEQAVTWILQDEKALNRSWLLRVPSVRHEYWQFRGKTALMQALASSGPERREKLRKTEYWIKKLWKSRLPWVEGTGYALAGAVAHARGDADTAAVRLRQALERFHLAEMGLYAAAVRLRLADLVQGDEGARLAETARAFLQEQRLRQEENWLSLLVPGFSPSI